MCPSYSSPLSPFQHRGWSCSRNSDHEVTLRMKASRNGKTEERKSLNIDDLVDSGLPVSGLLCMTAKTSSGPTRALFVLGGGVLFPGQAKHDSYMVRLQVGVRVCVLESGTQNKWIGGFEVLRCSKASRHEQGFPCGANGRVTCHWEMYAAWRV